MFGHLAPGIRRASSLGHGILNRSLTTESAVATVALGAIFRWGDGLPEGYGDSPFHLAMKNSPLRYDLGGSVV